jgi:chaperonin GroES
MNLVVNYWTSSLEEAERITQIYYFSERQVVSKKKQGWYLDIDLGEPNQGALSDVTDVRKETSQPGLDETTPYKILEQHTYLDLDGDGLREPYVVTVDYSTRKVLRISASYVPENVITDDKGKVISIEPIKYFTKFPCIPNPDGSFYDIGFGHLLGSINDSANTLVNQLVDSGTINNLQSGFIGKGLRIKMSDTKFTPGEWKAVNATSDDIKKGVFPLPTKEPSNVLFQLLGMLIQQSKELASVAEIFVGKMPGQNTPAYTTKETVEQGMKLFTAIYKRIYNSLTKEFRKLYKLNKVYLDPQEEIDVLDMTIEQSDYEGPENDVVPAADPTAASRTEKEQKAMALMQIMQIGTLDPIEVTKRILEAMEEPNIEALIKQPGPSPEQQQMQAEMQMKQQDSQLKQQESQAKLEIEKLKAQLDAQKQMMQMQFEKQKYEIQLQFEQMKAALDQKKAMSEHMFNMQKMNDDMAMNRVSGAQKLQQSNEAHKQKMKETNEKAGTTRVAK